MSRSSDFASSDYSSPSDSDPYASSSSSPSGYRGPRSLTGLPPFVDASSFPRPLLILGPLTGYTANARLKIINNRLARYETEIKRPLTEEEQKATIEHTAREFSRASYGPTLGISWAVTRWWRTRYEMRWLFLGKLRDETINKAANPMGTAPTTMTPPGPSLDGGISSAPPSQQPPLEGGPTSSSSSSSHQNPHSTSTGPDPNPNQKPKPDARTMRWDGTRLWAGQRELLRAWDPLGREIFLQGIRVLPYLAHGWILAVAFVGIYANATEWVEQDRDPRLKNMMNELRRAVEQRSGRKLPTPPPGNAPGGVPGGTTTTTAPGGAPPWRGSRDPLGQGQRTPGELWREHRNKIEKVDRGDSSGYDGDDASPTGSAPFSPVDMMGEAPADDSDGYATGATQQPSQQYPSGGKRSQNIYERNRRPQGPGSQSMPGGRPSTSSSAGRPSEYDYDPDSPTGGMRGSDDMAPTYPSSSSGSSSSYSDYSAASGTVGGEAGGSTWDRIRAQAGSSPSGSSSSSGAARGGQRPRGGQSSTADQDRDRAQQEFDARVERERRGGDFGGSSGGGKEGGSSGGWW